MSREEFKQFILSIGFISKISNTRDVFIYKDYTLYLHSRIYRLYKNNSIFYGSFNITDLNPLKRIERCVKLKKILQK